ncbi:Transmembrane Channel-Like Protein 7, partial [Manis pentadactyla]
AEPTALLQQEAHPEKGLGFKSPFYSTPVHRVQECSTVTCKARSTVTLHQ